ncbi:RNA-directed DNA polymerase, eukaryota, reverse transcriptase zinc-binding domain protein [Tanacetum coccineum]
MWRFELWRSLSQGFECDKSRQNSAVCDQLEWVLWYAPWLSDQLEWICGMLHGLVINWSSSAIETSRNRVNVFSFITVSFMRILGLREVARTTARIALEFAPEFVYGKLTKVTWKQVCKPKDCGGLGVKDLEKWNEALLAKHLWNNASKKDSLWVKWIHAVRLKDASIWNVQWNEKDGWNWKCLLEIRDKIAHNFQFKIRDGSNILMWYDRWHDDGLLINKVTNRDLYNARIPKMIGINSMMVNGEWNWPDEWNRNEFEVINIRPPMIILGKKDIVKWRCGNKFLPFHPRLVLEYLSTNNNRVDWYDIVWFKQCIPKHSFCLWLVMKKRLATQDRIMAWSNQKDLLCPLCNTTQDSHDHLFFLCKYSKKVWMEVAKNLNLRKIEFVWEVIVQTLIGMKNGNNIWSVVRRLSLAAVVSKDLEAVREMSCKVRVRSNGNLLWEASVLYDEKKGCVMDTLKFTAMPFGLTNAPTVFMEVNESGGVRVAREDDRGVTERREDVREVFQQCGSGAKRKLSRCGRNQMGNEPILALSEGADNFVVYYDARSKNLEACFEKGRSHNHLATLAVGIKRLLNVLEVTAIKLVLLVQKLLLLVLKVNVAERLQLLKG